MLFRLTQSVCVLLILMCCSCQEREVGTSSDLFKGKNGNYSEPTITVYYFHRTARCPSCMAIETNAAQAIKSNFHDQIKEGKLIWMPFNLDEPGGEEFKREFDITVSTLVVEKSQYNNILAYKKLDRVWQLLRDREEFSRYVTEEINRFMNDR